MPIRTIIFDYGSVLVRMKDESPRLALAEQYSVTLDELYQTVFDSPTAFPACLGKMTIDQHWRAVLQTLGATPGEKDAFVQQFWAADDLNYELVDYIRRQLRGKYTIGLLSNAWDDLRDILAQRWGIIDLFDDLIISAEVGDAKPKESIYRLALKRFDTKPEETIFIDDVTENVEGARAIGIHAIQYLDNQQLFDDLSVIINE